MKVGYFTFANIRIAETFIFDLIQGLALKSDITWFSGQKRLDENITASQYAIGFSPYENRWPALLFKIGQLKGDRGYRWRMSSRLHHANKVLNSIPDRLLPDVAYVEFLTTAVLVSDFFQSKNIPYIVHAHAYDITSELNDPYYRQKIKQVFKVVRSIIAPSDYIRKLLILEGCDPAKIEVVRLGIDASRIVPIPWREKRKDPPSLIFLGRLVDKKNPIALIHAFRLVKKEIPEVRLTIIGQGNLENEMRRLIKKFDLEESVTMTGALPRKKSFPIMNRHWIYVQHSVTTLSGDKEGAPVSISEAAAHALPVVSTLHSGIPEQVIDGETGYLVQEGDFETMAERIIKLIRDQELCEIMGKAGRRHILRINNPQKRVDKIFDLLIKKVEE